MWKLSETYNKEKPLEVDSISSSHVTYIRRNIEQVEVYDETLETTVKKWIYEENIIDKSVADIIIENTERSIENTDGILEVYEATDDLTDRANTQEDAILELYEMIGGAE